MRIWREGTQLAEAQCIETHDGQPRSCCGRSALEQLRQSEERFRAVRESTEVAVATLDRHGRLASVYAEGLGHLSAHVRSFIGRPLAEALGSEYAATHEAAHARVLQGEHVTYQWRLVTSGTCRFLRTAISPCHDVSGQITGAVWITRDITEMQRLKDQLLLSERMTSMGALAAGVAHEVNNPLAAVIANLDFARREVVTIVSESGIAERATELLEALGEALESAERIRLIVTDLRISSRCDEERREPVDVRRILESSVRLVWNEIRHRATITKDFGEVPFTLANEARLGQVFVNLLLNAAQAMPEGHAKQNRIVLRTWAISRARIAIEVQDTGCGMTPDVRERIFEPFFTTKPIGVGTGLGLPICHRILSEFGGEITVESELGCGTTIRMIMPACTNGPSLPSQAVPTPVPTRRGRILVIDDEPDVLQAVARILGLQHAVITCASALEARQRLASESFDLILCDMMMPNQTGADLYAELSETAPKLAKSIVFLTGGAFTPAARAFLERVPNPRVEKPFETRALLTLVNRLMR